MILIDTSVWVSHLRKAHPHLQELLLDEQVLGHPFIIGELACGHLKNRSEILSLLQALPQADVPEHQEVLHFIEAHRLMGRGIGIVDVHLLASAMLHRAPLWTADRSLGTTAAELNVLYGASENT